MAKEKKKKKKEMGEWREHVREMMYRISLEEAQKRTGQLNPPFNYRWEHVQAVVQAALHLAAATGADSEVVECAAWLHDVAKDAGEDHPVEGAKIARQLLEQTNFPAEKIESVAIAIENHMGLWRETPLTHLESQVLWDADKLTKIGITAAIHWVCSTMARDKMHTTESLMTEMILADWRKKTVASMHTAPAKVAAKTRLEAYNNLWHQLARELEGRDLPYHEDDVLS